MYSPSNSRQLFVVFDFDGVIADTRPLVTKAYAEAGVGIPDEAWGMPWDSWLPQMMPGEGDVAYNIARNVHIAKNHIYASMVAASEPDVLPAGILLQRLIAAGMENICVLTGASYDAAMPILYKIGVEVGEHLVLFEQDTSLKRMVVKALCDAGADVVYIDDIKALGEDVVRSTNARFVHYTGQTPTQLMMDISWTR